MTLQEAKKKFPEYEFETLDGFESAVIGFDLNYAKENMPRLVYSGTQIALILKSQGMAVDRIAEYMMYSVMRDSDTIKNFPIVVFEE